MAIVSSVKAPGGCRTDAFAGENGIRGVSELAVAIPNQEAELSDAVAEVHQQIARLLSDPRSAWDVP